MFCVNCGKQIPDDGKFCQSCGAQVNSTSGSQVNATKIEINTAPPNAPEPVEIPEIEYYRGEGELIVKRTEHRGGSRKAASLLAGGVIGYVAFGRDKTKKSKAKGTLVITNKAVYCAGNDYPFTAILSITKQGRMSKSILITLDAAFDQTVDANVRGLSVELELKTKDMDGLFQGLENAKMGHIESNPNAQKLTANTNSTLPPNQSIPTSEEDNSSAI